MEDNKIRKMVKVFHQVNMHDEDKLDVLFWLKKTSAERIGEVTRLRRNYFIWLNGSFPEKISKVINRKRL